MSLERDSFGEEEGGHSIQTDRRRKGEGTNSGIKSGTTNLEAESLRSKADSTGGCVNLKTVTEIRRSSVRDTVIAESVYLVLNSLWDWQPAERLKQESDMVSFTG